MNVRGPGLPPKSIVTRPEVLGLKTWVYDPHAANTGSAASNGRVYLGRMEVPDDRTITALHAMITAIGATLSAWFMALYDDKMTRLGLSADLSTAWSTGGTNQWVDGTLVGGPIVVADDVEFVYGALMANGTTRPTFSRSVDIANLASGGIVPASNGARFIFLSGVRTTMPETFTTEDIAGLGSPYWIGAS
jgi:hypothetical protein